MTLDEEFAPEPVSLPSRRKKADVNGAAEAPIVITEAGNPSSIIEGSATRREARQQRDEERLNRITALLDSPLNPALVKQREGFQGKMLDYIPWQVTVNNLNRIFGYDGWDTTIDNVTDLGVDGEGVPHAVRVTLSLTVAFGDYKSVTKANVGTGVNRPTRGGKFTWVGYDMAVKGAASDALKKAATALGKQFGLDLYKDKDEEEDDGDDSTPTTRSEKPAAKAAASAKCEKCGKAITGYTSKAGKTYTTEGLVEWSKRDCDGHVFCYDHKREYQDSQDD